MTEAEWNASTDPAAMLDWLAQHHKPSDRKPRLVACAAFRLQAFGEHQFARVDLLEQFADGKIEREKAIRKIEGDPFDWSEWYAAHPNAEDAARLSLAELSGGNAAHILRDIINPFRPVTLPAGEKCGECEGTGWTVAYAPIPERDVCDSCYGTGHGPSLVLTPLVKSLAEAAYQERREDGTLDPDRLEILADALIDAGMPEWEPRKPTRVWIRGDNHEWRVHLEKLGTVDTAAIKQFPRLRDAVAFAEMALSAKLNKVQQSHFLIGVGRDWMLRYYGEGLTPRQPHPLLAHLRSPGPHYRGCFAIDLLTGRG